MGTLIDLHQSGRVLYQNYLLNTLSPSIYIYTYIYIYIFYITPICVSAKNQPIGATVQHPVKCFRHCSILFKGKNSNTPCDPQCSVPVGLAFCIAWVVSDWQILIASEA